MKEFSLLIRVPTSYSSDDAKAVNPQWDNVLNQWKAGNVFVTSFVFPVAGYVISGADKMVKKEAVVSNNLIKTAINMIKKIR